MYREPAARTDDLVITQSGDDLLIYDQVAHEIHHLDAVAAAVWNACEVETSPERIAHATRLAPDVINQALQALSDANLLECPCLERPAPARGSRRALLRKAGIASATVVS